MAEYGDIVTEPPKLFPFAAKRDGIPFPKLKDPTGAAAAALDFLAEFKIPEGRAAGRPIQGKDLPPFIRQAIIGIIGHRDPETATRYFKRALFLAPRKNMKSYLSALIGIVFLFSRQEHAGEILIVASSQKQARRIFELTCAILRSNPYYWGQLRVQDIASKLTHLQTRTTLAAHPAEPAKLYGLSPSVLLLDELHTWTGDKGQRLWTSLTTAQGARANPLILSCTTVADRPLRETDIMLQEYRYAQKVASGELDDRRYLPMLWVCPEDADIHSPKVWKQYNPAHGFSISGDELKEEHARALQTDNGLSGFRTMRLNQIPRSALDRGWLSPAMLAKVTGPVDREEMMDAPRLAIGLDYGGSYDLASMVVVADDPTLGLQSVQLSWISQAGFDRIRKDFPEVEQMRDRGEVVVSGAEAVNAEQVVQEVADIANMFNLNEVALDPAMSQLIVPHLTANGLEAVEARQGAMSMAPVMTELEEAISQERFAIGDDRLFLWALGNTAQVSTSWGRRPAKIGNDEGENPAKIDPTSALLSALQLIQEQRNNLSASGHDGINWICPWTDPVNAQAVLKGGRAMAMLFTAAPTDPQTGGFLINA